MKRLATLCAVACMAIGLLPAKAFSLGNINTSFNYNQSRSFDSHDNKSINDSTVNATSNSNNRFDSSRRDDHSNSNNRQDNSDRSSKVTDSHNTDSRDFSDRSNRAVTSTDSHAISDSYKGNDNSVGKVADSYNGDRRTYNIEGSVSKSVIGDFNQKTAGTDFGSGGLAVSGSSNTIGGATSVSNTFGDVTISNSGK